MNLKLIDSAIKAYEGDLSDVDKQRLAFFRLLWDVQNAHEEGIAGASYNVPSTDVLQKLHAQETPIFTESGVSIDKQELVSTLDDLTKAALGAKVFDDSVADAFKGIDWQEVVDATSLEDAGSKPDEWFASIKKYLQNNKVEVQVADLAVHFSRMALRVQLEDSAKEVSRALKDAGAIEPHSKWCPVCGSLPMMAHVGGKTSSSGRGKLLVCPTCGTAWEYERVRCARCGTTNQAHLHFYNIEGDEAHRIATCDECGQYIRTLYSEDALLPCSYEVEDVVMARLDAVANDPRLAAASEDQ